MHADEKFDLLSFEFLSILRITKYYQKSIFQYKTCTTKMACMFPNSLVLSFRSLELDFNLSFGTSHTSEREGQRILLNKKCTLKRMACMKC